MVSQKMNRDNIAGAECSGSPSDDRHTRETSVSLCSAAWFLESSSGRRVSGRIAESPAHVKRAVCLAARLSIECREVASHDLWIASFFTQAGLDGDSDDLVSEIVTGSVYINDEPVTITSPDLFGPGEALLGLDGRIVFDAVLVTVSGHDCLVVAPPSHRHFAKDALLEGAE